MPGVLAIVPAREHSKGIPRKNWIKLVGITPLRRAINCAREVRQIQEIVVSTDVANIAPQETGLQRITILHRPPELATDESPMIDVVKHVLAQIPGPPEQILVLLQPTQPLRTPAHVQAAIALLEDTWADSVVSVVQLPPAHSPDMAAWIVGGQLYPYPVAARVIYADLKACHVSVSTSWEQILTRRQNARPAYIRDGTVYAFRRSTVEEHGTIYGVRVHPLIIPASETCPLDTPTDWADAERRLQA